MDSKHVCTSAIHTFIITIICIHSVVEYDPRSGLAHRQSGMVVHIMRARDA